MIKKNKASKVKEQQYVYVQEPKADHQGSKTPFTEFRWIDPYNVEKALPNNNSLVPKKWSEQNPSPSSHGATFINAQVTHTRRTNNIT